MAQKKVIVHNKSDRPDNIVECEARVYEEWRDLLNCALVARVSKTLPIF